MSTTARGGGEDLLLFVTTILICLMEMFWGEFKESGKMIFFLGMSGGIE